MKPAEPRWQLEAACVGHPPQWWSPPAHQSHDLVRAIVVCATCPVQDHCLAHSSVQDRYWTVRGGRVPGYLRGTDVALAARRATRKKNHRKMTTRA